MALKPRRRRGNESFPSPAQTQVGRPRREHHPSPGLHPGLASPKIRTIETVRQQLGQLSSVVQKMSSALRVIGDVHGQIDPGNLFTRDARPYFEIISGAPYSIQMGDMGDGETYDQLISSVDAGRHRFFPGNHENYDRLPPHNLGDFGSVSWGGVHFFFVRGAASTDREVLLRLGSDQGKTLWFEQEELTEEQMRAAEHEYLRARPQIVLSHDAPTHVAHSAWQHARRFSPPNSRARFSASRTTDFLERLLGQHQPRTWLFGHHHHNWRHRESASLFVCVGELSHVDIDSAGLPLPSLRF